MITPHTRPPWRPTQDDLDAVLAWSSTQGLTWMPKSRSPLMRTAGLALGAVGVLGRDRFMRDYTTVLRHRAYAPWVGTPAATTAECWARIGTVVHEVQHWIQWQREPGLRFATLYLASAHHRAMYEAEAYGVNLELAAWNGTPLRDPSAIAAQLSEYGCGPDARDAGLDRLLEVSERARRGEFTTEATLRVLPVLEALRGG